MPATMVDRLKNNLEPFQLNGALKFVSRYALALFSGNYKANENSWLFTENFLWNVFNSNSHEVSLGSFVYLYTANQWEHCIDLISNYNHGQLAAFLCYIYKAT